MVWSVWDIFTTLCGLLTVTLNHEIPLHNRGPRMVSGTDVTLRHLQGENFNFNFNFPASLLVTFCVIALALRC